MSFLTPLALSFLITLPLVALMHLLRERRVVTRISSLILWQWAEKEVHGPRLKTIKFSFLLFLHLLIAVLLSLALARPVFSEFEIRVPRHLILILDLTTSMGAADIQPTRFGAAQERAIKLLNALQQNDTYTLIEMRARSTILAQGDVEDVPWARDLIGRLGPVGIGADWLGALALANAVVDPAAQNEIYTLTDAAIPDLERSETQFLSAEVVWEIINSASPSTGRDGVDNAAVLSLTSRLLPSGSAQVLARAANYSDREIERKLVLTVDGEKAEELTLVIAGGGTIEQTWTLTPGVQIVEVTLEGDDLLPDDDRATLALDQTPQIDVLLVARQSSAEDEPAAGDILMQGFSAFSNVDLQTVTPGDYRLTSGYDLYVFIDFIPERFPNGSVLLINPPPGNALIETGQPIPNTSFVAVPQADPLTVGIDWRSWRVDMLTPITLPEWASGIVFAADEHPLLFRGRTGKTALVGIAFDLTQSNLPNKISFPILLSSILSELTPPHVAATVDPGVPMILSPGRYQEDIRIIDPTGQEFVLAPGFEPVFMSADIPGLYTARGLDASGKSWQENFAVNVGASIESDLRPRTPPDVTVAELPDQVSTMTDMEVWRYLVVFSLILLVLETWLAWR